MKKLLLVLSTLISIVSLMAFSGGGHETNSTGGAPAGFAGDPAASSATCRSCHSGPTAPTIPGIITSNIPPGGYMPGTTYTITANFVRAGHSKFGFEISPQNTSGVQKGTLANIIGTQLVGAGGKYITHVTGSTSGSGSKTWNFKWTAPAIGLGPVTFYGAFNATNSSNTDLGDSIFKSTMVATEDPTAAIYNLQENILSFTTFPNPAINNINVKLILLEQSSVEMDLFDINGNKVSNLFSETEMNGEVNKSLDISSYPKGIYFIRLNADGNSSLSKIVKM